MKAFQLTEKKEFMNLLLRTGVFDNFLLSEASLHTAVKYEIDGRRFLSLLKDGLPRPSLNSC